MAYTIGFDTVVDGTITATNLTGTSTGTNTGDQTSVTGNAGTVTNIGNLTGEVTSTNRATVLDPTAITGKTTVTVAAGDLILISDTSDSGNLKKIAASDLMGALSDGDYGDITVSSGGTVLTIDSDTVTNVKLADMATSTFKGRTTAGTGDPEDLTIAQAKTLLNLTGTNSGDQTSIVGITGTLAEFNTALTGADFASGGGTATGTNTGDQTSIVGITGTLAQFNTAVTDANLADDSLVAHLAGAETFTSLKTFDVAGTNDDARFGSHMGVYGDTTPSLFFNAYLDAGTWKYKTTNFATKIEFDKATGILYFYTAPSGTIDTAITWTARQVLLQAGNVGIGTTNPINKLVVAGASGGFEFDTGNLILNSFDRGTSLYTTLKLACLDFTLRTGASSTSRFEIDSNGVATFLKAVRGSQTALTSTSNSIAIDFASSNDFTHTFTENTTLANGSNVVVGQSGFIFLEQHASSPKTLAFGSIYKFKDGTPFSVSAVNSAKDTIGYSVRSATFVELNIIKAMA